MRDKGPCFEGMKQKRHLHARLALTFKELKCYERRHIFSLVHPSMIFPVSSPIYGSRGKKYPSSSIGFRSLCKTDPAFSGHVPPAFQMPGNAALFLLKSFMDHPKIQIFLAMKQGAEGTGSEFCLRCDLRQGCTVVSLVSKNPSRCTYDLISPD
jgi:hypothetical protein